MYDILPIIGATKAQRKAKRAAKKTARKQKRAVRKTARQQKRAARKAARNQPALPSQQLEQIAENNPSQPVVLQNGSSQILTDAQGAVETLRDAGVLPAVNTFANATDETAEGESNNLNPASSTDAKRKKNMLLLGAGIALVGIGAAYFINKKKRR